MKQKVLIILVCSEGKHTEKAFIDQIVRTFRINPRVVRVRVKQGAHKTLIDNCVKERASLSKDLEVGEDLIEVWAMCDKDSYKGKFSDLKKYADKNNVNLAYSAPQIESFFMEFFARFGRSYKGEKLLAELSDQLKKTKTRDGKVLRSSYSKTDLDWVGKLLDDKPGLLIAAMKNANHYDNQTKTPFFTVQDLIKRLLEFKT